MMDNNGLSAKPLTLSGLNTLLGNAVRTEPRLQGVWVIAELSDVRSSGGHFYMELIEKDQRGATVAKLRANLWAATANHIRSKFYNATGRDITTGIKVMLRGSVTHHNIYGLSFNIQDIDPSYTLGDLERLRREILEQLYKEGVLENNRRLPFPAAPQNIAVISAAGAAGYGDFTNQLASSPEGFVFYPLLFGAVMQGEKTAPSVMQALDKIEETLDFWDAVVIIRGGGSTSDLNGFDNLELARRVATYPIPVIIGIGHERDRTVLDDIACVRCKTPTAVAAFLIDTLRQALDNARNLGQTLARFAAERLEGDRRQLDNLSNTLPAIISSVIGTSTLKLQKIAGFLPMAVGRRTANEIGRIASLGSALSLGSANLTGAAERKLEDFHSQLNQSIGLALQRQEIRLSHLENVIGILSPANTLRRGYSITRINGKAVTSSSEVTAGAEIETTLFEGIITSHVQK